MAYFSHFPQVPYDVRGDGNPQQMINITKRVRFRDYMKTNFVTYDFYDVKRSLIGDGTITPIQNDLDATNIPILEFTAVKLNEFNKENYLFPPKSTWITPRI